MSAFCLTFLLVLCIPYPTLHLPTTSSCCPEFPTSDQCSSLCRLGARVLVLEQSINPILAELEGKRLRMLQARTAPDKEMEQSLLGNLKEAFVIIENCAQFNICNGGRADFITRGINNIGELFVSHSLTNFSSGFSEDLHLSFGLIQSSLSRARSNSSSVCPTWIPSLGLQDSLTGSLCILFNEQPPLSFSEEHGSQLTDCSEEFMPLVKSVHSLAMSHLKNSSHPLPDPQDSFIRLVITRSCTDLASITSSIKQMMQRIKDSVLYQLRSEKIETLPR